MDRVLPFLPLPLPDDISRRGAEETAPAEQAASWAPGDAVRFRKRNRMASGSIARCNPSTAEVRGEDDKSWRVPYAILLPGDSRTGEAFEARRTRLAEISHRARTELHRHKLPDWDFAWDAAQQRGGICNYEHKFIGLSASYALAIDDQEVLDTLLHEIAHALVGPKHHHDETWSRKARSIGCSAKVVHNVTFSMPRWEGSCPNDCSRMQRLRRNRLICRLCGEWIQWRRLDSPPPPDPGA